MNSKKNSCKVIQAAQLIQALNFSKLLVFRMFFLQPLLLVWTGLHGTFTVQHVFASLYVPLIVHYVMSTAPLVLFCLAKAKVVQSL